jgi:hypothetical protein
MESKFYVLVSQSENDYGSVVSLSDMAYSNKKQAKAELAKSYTEFLKDCDRGAVGNFEEYYVDIKSMKDFSEWKVTSASVPHFYERMRIEEVTVSIKD